MEKYWFILIAYFIGSIPFSYILGKWFKKEDLRTKGSGNLGTTNAYRVLGRAIGTAVLILDTFKSGLMVFLIKYTDVFADTEMFNPLIYGFASVIGHIYPVWFAFRGGKGVASSLGLLMVYNPIIALIVVPIFLIVEFIFRYASVASVAASISALIVTIVFHLAVTPDLPLVIVTLLAVLLIIIKHSANYERLRQGTENRVHLFDFYDRWQEKRKSKKAKTKDTSE
ncbi:MAG: glycerol-3-phosphate 1-O-acyltransferase PlsY [Bacilli bacterium]|nr:glycerol-3-phosphate 1-O-acyltransferase PlsY [Bacilli bacterium]MBN2696972.1 glycerol-3-phosphate 1-O-acyltransferase PlsY [Bacilli bacterium]